MPYKYRFNWEELKCFNFLKKCFDFIFKFINSWAVAPNISTFSCVLKNLRKMSFKP